MRRFEKSLLLDIGRMYFSPENLIRLLDLMRQNGMNALLLHFSEDMGVGIECPDYPFLAGREGILCPFREVGSVHPDPSFLTVAELRQLVKEANARGIEIIPSYDAPGHLNYTVKKVHDLVREEGVFSFSYAGNTYKVTCPDGKYRFFKNGVDLNYPENTSGVYGIGSYFTLNGVVERVKGSNNHAFSRGIDLTNEVAVAFVHSLQESYAKLFRDLGCKQFDIGCDELLGYCGAIKPLDELPRWRQLDTWENEAKRVTGKESAVAYDLFVLFANKSYDLIKKYGYDTVRIWNDEFCLTNGTGWTADPAEHIQFNKDFLVQFWSLFDTMASPVSLAKAGYDIVGTDCMYCYYVLIDDQSDYQKVTPKALLEEWNPFSFGNKENGNVPADWDLAASGLAHKVKGTMFCVWTDCPAVRTEAEVIEDLAPLLAAWSKKTDMVLAEN